MPLRFTLVVLITILFTGCAISPSGKYRDANVSDAARQAGGQAVAIPRAEYEPVTGNLRHEENHRQSVYVDKESADTRHRERASNGKFGVQYMRVQYESGSLQEGRFYSVYAESPYNGMQSIGASLTYGTYDLPVSGIVGDSIDWASSINWALFTKFYAGDFSFVVSPYVLFSLGYGNMMWEYRQPITDNSGYTFSSDSLEYMELKAGVGGELGRYGALQISAYAGPVARVYLGRTYEGFNNDLFEDRLDFTWSGMIGFGY